jgi:hypothetical protein
MRSYEVEQSLPPLISVIGLIWRNPRRAVPINNAELVDWNGWL